VRDDDDDDGWLWDGWSDGGGKLWDEEDDEMVNWWHEMVGWWDPINSFN